MFAQVHKPDVLTGEELDTYLNEGWFRNAQRIFTTNFLNFNNQFYSAIWLRIQLNELTESTKFKKISKQNKAFKITIQPASITDEKEALFQLYKTSISFSASQSLHALLVGESQVEIFNTYEVLLHDADELIGVGYFDIGNDSAAGIISFYNPAYKKNSIGTYLILLKIEYCKQQKLTYFYPGYFAPNYPAFDYKLAIGTEAIYFLQLRTHQWVSLQAYISKDDIYARMNQKLQHALHVLHAFDVACDLYRYSFFEANIIPNLAGFQLFDFPIFITFYNEIEDLIHPIIVYDVVHQCYHLLECISVWKADNTAIEPGNFSKHLLKFKKHICSTQHADEMVRIILEKKLLNTK